MTLFRGAGAIARAILPASVAAIFAALAGVPGRLAFAAPLSAVLSVERAVGAEDCPDQASLERLLGQMLRASGGGPAPAAGDTLRAQIHFTHADAGYQATLRIDGATHGERTLTDTGPTCAAIGRAVGVTLALLLDAPLQDPPAAPPRSDERAAGAPPPPLVGVAAAPVVPTGANAAATPRATTGLLTIAAGPALGLVGAPAAAAALGLDLRFTGRIWLGAAAEYVAARQTAFDEGSVSVALLAARARACAALTRAAAAVAVAACVVALAGQLRGEGSGYPSSNAAAMTWLGAGGGAQAVAALGDRFVVGARADLVAPLRSYTFSVENRGVAYRSPALGATLQLGIGVRIW